MPEDRFDVIVVGAGMAGLACAGELVLRGQRPLLICETSEVAHNLRSVWVAGDRGVMQHPFSMTGWGGGWWFHLVRSLNIDVRVQHLGGSLDLMIRGTGKVSHVPFACASGSALTNVIAEFSPLPIDDVHDEIEQILTAALAIPYWQLVTMQDAPLEHWLKAQGATEFAQFLIMAFCGPMMEMSPDEARKHLSVYGAFGPLRCMLCGEGSITVIAPDAREGLAIPIAKEVERRGGAVWRGQRVREVLTDKHEVRGVALEDGREVRAPVVAIAAGNSRIGGLFNPIPPEIQDALDYSASLSRQEFSLYALLDKPVMTRDGGRADSYVGVLNTDASFLQWVWPLHEMTPWSTEAGKQFLACERFLSPEEISEAGGTEAVFADMHKVNEELYPGYTDALVASQYQNKRHHWADPLHLGPKLPRTIDSVRNLWFVGDGSAPIAGIFMDTAASAGILGARGIVGAKSDQPIAID